MVVKRHATYRHFRASYLGVSADAEIYERYRADLLRYATVLVGSSQAEDVVSTIVLRVLRGRGLAALENPRAYLMKAVLNESKSVHRGRIIESALDRDHATRSVADTWPVLDAVMRLPVRQRAAVFLFYWEGRSIKEAAELMGVTPGAVKRYLYLSRHRLRSVLR